MEENKSHSNSNFILFKTDDQKITVDVRFEEETVWLTQDQIATLFDKGRSTIAEHILNVFKEGELQEEATCRKFRQVRSEGNRNVERNIEHYNLDVNGHTASEIIFNRADAEKEYMGLTTFPGDRPYIKDVVIAKNYLDEKELRALGQIVSGYLDFAERQAEREEEMTMKNWSEHLDRILTMSGEKLLRDNGKISNEEAINKAKTEYKKYQQKTLSEVEKNFLESLKLIENKSKNK